MQKSVLVLDDFFDNPGAARRTALGLTYPEPPPTVYYPGRNSRESMAWPGSNEMFSRILGEPVEGHSPAHGRTRVTLASDTRRGRVHVDPGCTWAAIIYLSLDEHGSGGTDFFRHRPSDSERAPLTDEEAQRLYGKPTPREALIELLSVESASDESRWERVWTLPMKFNRCVIFRPWFWHSSGDGFGDSIENGRLIQLLFFKPGPGAVGAVTVPEL